MERICVEIDNVFYESLAHASKSLKYKPSTIKRRCLSNDRANYKIVPFRITYTEKRCTSCEKVKLLDDFCKHADYKDGFAPQCKKCKSDYDKEYCQNNREKVNEKRNRWERNNLEYFREYKKRRRKNDPVYKLNCNIRAIIRKSLRDGKNGRHWEDLVKYNLDKLKEHLESLFREGMSWKNYGKGEEKWHIDHIIPVSLFNITSVKSKGFRACWALENLRPMWEKENLRKSNKLFY